MNNVYFNEEGVIIKNIDNINYLLLEESALITSTTTTLAPTTTTTTTIDTSLKHRWLFNDAIDDIGGLTGTTLSGGVIIGGKLITGTGYFRVPATAMNMRQYSGLTISAWVKSSSSNTGYRQAIAFGNLFTSNYIYNTFSTTLSENSGEIGIQWPSYNRYVRYQNINDNTTHHFAMTLDNNYIKSYIDGLFISEISISDGSFNFSTLNNTYMYIGRGIWNEPFWIGETSQFEIYNVVKDATQITEIYNKGIT